VDAKAAREMPDARPHGLAMRPYVAVWGALILLTALTVTVAGFNLQKIAIVACLAIAAVKSTLVLFYFMHLRYEQRLIIKLAIPIALAALAIFIGLTFSDVITR
jgi:cytochrome c oxidase subunit 4